MVTLITASAFMSAFNIQTVRAAGTIYIRADGSVDPLTAPILNVGNVYYTFTADIYDSIVVERGNVIVDGASYTLQGSGSGKGFYWFGINNVTLENTNIEYFEYGIGLESSSSNSISGNNITANIFYGIGLGFSSGNTLSGNNIANNADGIVLEYSSNNRVFHNNLINDANQVYSSNSVNVWDEGYPSGGNYWSDYTGEDTHSGQHQNLPGNDGLGDTPYIIDADNRDNYTLMEPWSWAPHDVAVQAVTLSRNIVGQGYSMHTNITVTNRGTYTEAFNVTLYANATLIETREVVLSSGNSTTLTFTWETFGFVKGNYTISVVADSVPGEIYSTDNTFFDGWAFLTLPGDVDGDRDVDIFDIVRMAGVYGARIPDPKYDLYCDIDYDGDIDIFDIVIAAGNYGESW